MHTPRLYLEQRLSPDLLIELPEEAAHHVMNVMRLNSGDVIRVFNTIDGEYSAQLLPHGKNRRVMAQIIGRIDNNAEPSLHLILGQAIARSEKMDYIVQKATELGVRRIVPLETTHGNVKLDEKRTGHRIEHWRRVAVSAAEQCGRLSIPEIAPPMPYVEWLTTLIAGTKLLLDTENAVTLDTLPRPPPNGPIGLAVGPEGGWSAAERRLAQQGGFQALRLGSRILRTETAGAAALAALHARWGDFIAAPLQ